MRKFEICYPEFDENGSYVNTREIFTEEKIIETYFPHFSEEMKRAGKEHLISEENCIENWIIVNWAIEIFEE